MDNKTKPGLIKRILTKRNILIAVVFLVLIGIFTKGFGLFVKKATDKYEIKKGVIKEEIVISGEVKAEKYSAMTFSSSGKIGWVGVTEGQEVYRGQALIKLDTDILNSAFETAKANLRSAEANVQYVHDVVKDHTGDETYYQKTTRTTAEASKDAYYEAYKVAEENLKNATLYAPFKGIVSSLISSAPGVNVLFSETAVGVVDPETIYFEVYADQTEITKLSSEQKVELILDAYPDEVTEVKINYLALTPQSVDGGSLYKVKISFSEKPDIQKFRIGMTGDVRFIIKEKGDVLEAPLKFINSDQKGKYVLVRNMNNKVYVETGLEGEETIEIIGNIKEGDILLN
jgi:RND family efflux transporter MFP subunit